MRALHVIAGLAARTGGPAAAAVDMCRALARHGVDARLLSTDLATAAAGAPARPVRPDELPSGAGEVDVVLARALPPRRLAHSPQLARLLAREARAADVVHVHGLFLHSTFAAYRAAGAAGVPYVVSPHGALDPWLRRRGRLRKRATDLLWQRAMLERASLLHFGAQDEARLAADVAPEVARLVVSNPVDVDAFDEPHGGDGFRARAGVPSDAPLVVFLGRLTAKKGLDLLARAFARAAAELPDAHLAIVGPDDEGVGARVARIARELGVADRVHLVGMLAGDARLGALDAADVWALASYSDASAVAVLEALAAGCAVLLSPAVNVAPEAEAAGAAAVAPLEADAFGSALAELLRDEPRRAELGRRARGYARTFDLDVVGRVLADAYTAVAGSAP